MNKLFSQLWADDAGIVSLEYLILATILGLGLIVGVTTLLAALNSEFAELSQAVLTLDQSFQYNGFSSCVANTNGAEANDSYGNINILENDPATANTIIDNPCI